MSARACSDLGRVAHDDRGDQLASSASSARVPRSLASRAERGDGEQRALARRRRARRERPSDGATEPLAPVERFDTHHRERDPPTALFRHHEQCRGRPAYHRQQRGEIVHAAARRERWPNIHDRETETLAAQRGRAGEEHLGDIARAHDDDPVEIHARAHRRERIERGGRIDPRDHAALALRRGRDVERERELARGQRSDERERLPRPDAAPGHAVERRPGRDAALAVLALGDVAPHDGARAVSRLDARDSLRPVQWLPRRLPFLAVPPASGAWPSPDVIRTYVLERREHPETCQEAENRPKPRDFLARARHHSWTAPSRSPRAARARATARTSTRARR